jgi:short-subunit dehydrogenase
VQVDGLINCAGILPPFASAVSLPIDTFKSVMDVDYFACIYAINALYPTISASSTPSIINVGSAAALATIVGTSAYSAAKSAIKAYSEALTYELKGKAYVSTVMPGFARTDIFRSQNSEIDDNKLFLLVSMPADKMVNKIYRGIKRRRTRMTFGIDAFLMGTFYRLFPRLTMLVISKVVKSVKLKLFENVFDN